MAQLTLEQIKILAPKMWEECHGGDGIDKMMWINGFVIGAVSMLGTPLSEIETELEKEYLWTFKRKLKRLKLETGKNK